VAREYGFASRTGLRDEVAARTRAWPVRRKHSARPASVTARAGRPGCWRPPPSPPATASRSRS
jgi:hypothetical protein